MTDAIAPTDRHSIKFWDVACHLTGASPVIPRAITKVHVVEQFRFAPTDITRYV